MIHSLDPEEVRCPLCGGATWDNRFTKRNPKGPDYKCKTCHAAGWLQPTGGWRWSLAPYTKRD